MEETMTPATEMVVVGGDTYYCREIDAISGAIHSAASCDD
jgi:hypothetical protein